MRAVSHRRLALLATAVGLTLATFTPPAMSEVAVRFRRLHAFHAPGTPARLDKVGVLEIGPRSARNVLVLNPGTSASAAYFAPLAKTVVSKAKGWQVWAVERRENQLEDHSVLDRAKQGMATNQELFDYYLGWLTDPTVTTHFQFILDSDVGFAREWGMRVEIEDLRRVVEAAKRRGGRVVLGGHSLGGSITSAYATWDFDGEPGARDLSGLVFIDGGSSPTPASPDQANMQLQALQNGSPWLSFGGIPAPYAGLFNATGSTGVKIAPNDPSLGYAWPALPANLKPPVPPTNEAQYGYALDVKTSPMGLRAAQAHLGQLKDSGDPRGWDGTGALTPITRYAEMFSGWGLQNRDGTAWYHPQRITIDSGAVAEGNANDTQSILDVHATHGHELPKQLRMYAFGAALGGQRVLDGATILADQSGIPHDQLVLVNGEADYAHNDPAGASPNNEFLRNLTPFLNKIG